MAVWPSPLPAWFWAWAEWYLGRGDFKGHARDPEYRPDAAPDKVPAWAWARLALVAAGKPAPPAPTPAPKPAVYVIKQGPRARHDSGPRSASFIKWAVIHSAEASDDVGGDTTAEGVANFFAGGSAEASTQLAADRDSIVRCLPDLVIPWGATGANTNGLHIELCGRAGWTRDEWLEPARRPMLDRAAFAVAKWCLEYRIPVRWLTPADLRNGVRGMTTHKDVNDAFRGGSHWDPGTGFPRDVFISLVQRHAAALAV